MARRSQQKLRDSSQPLTAAAEGKGQKAEGSDLRRITYRGTVYAVGEEVEDRNTGDRLVITGFTCDRVAWVRKGEGSPYCLGMGHIKKVRGQESAVLSHGSDPRGFIREDDLQGLGDPIASLTAALTPPIDAELFPPPTEHLTQLEGEIETGQQLRAEGERRIWMAAAAIRQHDLWKLHVDRQGNPIYRSFPDYCKQKWGWERSYSHAIAQTGQVVLQLKQSGTPDNLLPDSVSQGTELAKLEPEQRLEVIDRVVETQGRLSAKAIREARERYLEEDHQAIVGDEDARTQGEGDAEQEEDKTEPEDKAEVKGEPQPDEAALGLIDRLGAVRVARLAMKRVQAENPDSPFLAEQAIKLMGAKRVALLAVKRCNESELTEVADWITDF